MNSNYLFEEKVFVHEFPEAVCIVRVVGMDVELERVKVSTEKEEALRQLDVLLLERDRLHFANRVNGIEGYGYTQSIASCGKKVCMCVCGVHYKMWILQYQCNLQ